MKYGDTKYGNTMPISAMILSGGNHCDLFSLHANLALVARSPKGGAATSAISAPPREPYFFARGAAEDAGKSKNEAGFPPLRE